MVNNMKNFQLKIRELRHEYSFTQQQVADKLNVSKSTITHWELGDSKPSIESLLELSKMFGVSVGYLVGAEDEFGRPVPSDLSERDRALLKAFHKLHPFEQETILIQINALAEKVKN